ncbi:MAG: ATP-binding protein [Microthrixaceae bacterium]
MVASTEPSGSGRAIGPDPRTPLQLLTWEPGAWAEHARAAVHAVDASPGGFDLRDWVAAQLSDGQEVAAVVYPSHRAAAAGAARRLDLDELTRSAAGLSEDSFERRVFTGDTLPTSLRALRRWAGEQLESSPYPVEDVVLALSELSTNVERHAGGWLTVDLIRTQDVLVVAVTDPQVQRLPRVRAVGPDELTGRGLLVVASLAACWGVVVRPSSKSVWAAICPTGTSALDEGYPS